MSGDRRLDRADSLAHGGPRGRCLKIAEVSPSARLTGLSYDLFGKIVDRIYSLKHGGAEGKLTSYATVTLNWHSYGESNGDLNLMYFRTYLGGEVAAELEFDVKAVEVGVELAAGKQELIYESIGSQTVSYVNRQFLYQTEDRPWEAFVANNRAEIAQLVQNIATPGTLYYDAGVAAAYGQGGFEAGLAALEQAWTEQNQDVIAARDEASKLAAISNKWALPWRTEGLANKASQVLEGIEGDELRDYTLGLVDDLGGDPARLEALADPSSTSGRRLSALLSRLPSSNLYTPPAP